LDLKFLLIFKYTIDWLCLVSWRKMNYSQK
jgi:hypothetical protein